MAGSADVLSGKKHFHRKPIGISQGNRGPGIGYRAGYFLPDTDIRRPGKAPEDGRFGPGKKPQMENKYPVEI
jgi:hypothetical protein